MFNKNDIPMPMLALGAIVFFAVFSGSAIVTSLLYSVALRLCGSDWTALDAIGSFWSGHLNGFAIIFLLATLLLQGRQMSQQAEQTDQAKAENAQMEFKFAMEHLNHLAASIEFAIDRDDNEPRTISKGARALVDVLERQQDQHDHIAVDLRRLAEFIAAGNLARKLAEKLPPSVTEVGTALCHSLSPPALALFCDTRLSRRTAQIGDLVQLDVSPATKERLRALIEAGWDFERFTIGKLGHSVALTKDLPHEQIRVSSSICAPTMEDAIESALAQMNA
jgi:hypothetical protein